MNALPILVIVVGIGIAISVAVISYRVDQKRRALLQSFARSSGWVYAPRDDSWCDRFVGNPFGDGDHRSAQNVLTGTYGDTSLVAFDYSFQTHSTDSKGNRHTTTHRYAVCALGLPAPLPGLELSPESVLTRFAGAIGFDDVQLESEDFNRRYRVQANDKKFAYDVLNPRTMAALLARPALHLRLLDVDALCFESGRLEPVGLMSRLATLQLLITGIPSFVWSDRAVSVPPPEGACS